MDFLAKLAKISMKAKANGAVRIEMPMRKPYVRYSKGQYQLKVPFAMYANFESLLVNPILPGLLNTLQTQGGIFYPPPNSLVFYPRSIKFGM